MSDPASGLRWPKAVGAAAAHVVGGFLLTFLLLLGIGLALGGADFDPNSTRTLFLQGVAMTLGYAMIMWLLGRRALRLGWDEMGVAVPGKARGFVFGFIGAAGLALMALVLAVPAAGASWTPDAGGFGAWLATAARNTAMLAPAALAEELMLRGLPIVLLARVFGRGNAVVVLAVLFGLLHARNPEVGPLALGNIALAGVFLGLAFFAPGGLWTAWGAHLGWNATIAASDAPVSGIPFQVPLIDYDPGAPAWLSGGAFGPEGGVLATLVLLLGCYFLGRRARKDEPA